MEILEYFLAILGLVSALGVVFNRNPIYAALSLIVNLLTVAGFYALLHSHFLALTQITVYAGAIVVLMLFVIMLLNEKVESRSLWFYAAGVPALLLMGLFFKAFVARDFIADYNLKNVASSAESLGRILFGKYALTFEIASLLILIGLITIVMLGKLSKKEPVDDSK